MIGAGPPGVTFATYPLNGRSVCRTQNCRSFGGWGSKREFRGCFQGRHRGYTGVPVVEADESLAGSFGGTCSESRSFRPIPV
jgi:hypothetical protein